MPVSISVFTTQVLTDRDRFTTCLRGQYSSTGSTFRRSAIYLALHSNAMEYANENMRKTPTIYSLLKGIRHKRGCCLARNEKMSQDKHNTTNITEMALTSLKNECFKKDIETAEQLLSNQGELLMRVLRENRPYWRECPHCEAFHKPRRDKKVADCKKRGRAPPDLLCAVMHSSDWTR